MKQGQKESLKFEKTKLIKISEEKLARIVGAEFILIRAGKTIASFDTRKDAELTAKLLFDDKNYSIKALIGCGDLPE